MEVVGVGVGTAAEARAVVSRAVEAKAMVVSEVRVARAEAV